MRIQKTLPLAALAVAAFAITACQDGASTPASPESSLRPQGPRLTLATTQVTTAVIYPTIDNVYVSSEGHRLSIPAYSICNPGTAGYGPQTWNLPCTPATAPIALTITSTVDASGNPRITVKPDIRFSPSKTVTASFVDQAAANAFNSFIAYCPTVGGCYDESKTDASLKTYTDPATGRVYRRIKHFSGYTVIIGADCEDPTSCESQPGLDRAAFAARASGYITTTGIDAGEPLSGLGSDR